MQPVPTRRGGDIRPAVGPDIQSRAIDLRHDGNTSFGDAVGLQTSPRELSGQSLPAPDRNVQSNVYIMCIMDRILDHRPVSAVGGNPLTFFEGRNH